MRIAGASRLDALREDLAAKRDWLCWIFAGIVGTGGAFAALGTGGEALEGDGSRKVRSLIDPELTRRTNCDPGGPHPVPDTELAADEFELALFNVLFVCTSATRVGVVGRDRNAVAAAADESDALDC
jgi:hypothetical protein